MEINRTLSRSALTVQDMTVDSAIQPILPPIDTPRCELAPISRHCYASSQRREERGSPALGCCHLTVLRSLVATSIPDNRTVVHVPIGTSLWNEFLPAGSHFFIPIAEDKGLSKMEDGGNPAPLLFISIER